MMSCACLFVGGRGAPGGGRPRCRRAPGEQPGVHCGSGLRRHAAIGRGRWEWGSCARGAFSGNRQLSGGRVKQAPPRVVQELYRRLGGDGGSRGSRALEDGRETVHRRPWLQEGGGRRAKGGAARAVVAMRVMTPMRLSRIHVLAGNPSAQVPDNY